MSLAQEIDALHDLCELHQRLRPEVQREQVAGTIAGPCDVALRRAEFRIVEVCRAILAKAEASE